MATEMKQILEKLEEIKIELDDLKERMVDPDAVLDEEDIIAIYEAEKEEKEGKLTSLEELKKELKHNV